MSISTLNIYCDGGARGNPGPAAGAFVVLDGQNQQLFKKGQYLGITTNNQAEYQAVVHSLLWLREFFSSNNYKPITINYYLDSQLVVNQLKLLFKVKDPVLRQLHSRIKSIEQQLTQKSCIFTYQYIPRILNSTADSIVNLVLDTQTSQGN